MPVIQVAAVLAIVSIYLALYGHWFARWTANLWIAHVDHEIGVLVSIPLAVATIFLAVRTSKGLRPNTIALCLGGLVLLDSFVTLTFGSEPAMYAVMNSPTLAVVSLSILLVYRITNVDLRLDQVLDPWCKWWHVAAAVVLGGIVFTFLKIDFLQIDRDLENRLKVLFTMVGPLVLAIVRLAQGRRPFGNM